MLVARTSHPLTLADGFQVEGTRGVGLCAGGDHDAPDAQGPLAFFAVHETVTDETVTSVTALLTEWVDRVARDPTLCEQDIRDEIVSAGFVHRVGCDSELQCRPPVCHWARAVEHESAVGG
jgi:hypothetical protein